jgi:hypothetical protein
MSVHGLSTTFMKRCSSALASGIAFGHAVDADSCARSDSDAARFHAVAKQYCAHQKGNAALRDH